MCGPGEEETDADGGGGTVDGDGNIGEGIGNTGALEAHTQPLRPEHLFRSQTSLLHCARACFHQRKHTFGQAVGGTVGTTGMEGTGVKYGVGKVVKREAQTQPCRAVEPGHLLR